MAIQKLEDLKVWQEARILMKLVYKITSKFPKSEEYNLKKHMRECSRNICGNIAEGFGRFHWKESMQFYRIARGSLAELKSDGYCSFDAKYISREDLKKLINQNEKVNMFLNGLINSTFNLKNNKKSTNSRFLITSTDTAGKGFTLVEIIVTVAILVIALTTAGSLLVSIIKIQARTNASRTVQEEARNIMETIAREAKLVAGSSTYPPFLISNLADNYSRDELMGFITSGISIKFSGDQLRLTSEDNSEKKASLKNPNEFVEADPATYPDPQPFVNIFFIIRSTTQQDVYLILETTVSSRDYGYGV